MFLSEAENKMINRVMRVVYQSPAVVDPMHVWTFHARNLGGPNSPIRVVQTGRLTKVINYNVNLYVVRKSDKGIVPMKPRTKICKYRRRAWRKGL